jgi:hypothetical protein
VDEDGQAEAAGELGELEPVPLLFCTCRKHKSALLDWARALWGTYAEGVVFPIRALPALVEKIGSDGWPVAVNPDTHRAYELVPVTEHLGYVG